MLQGTHLEESGRDWGLQTHGGLNPGVGSSGMSVAGGKNPPGTHREHPERGRAPRLHGDAALAPRRSQKAFGARAGLGAIAGA